MIDANRLFFVYSQELHDNNVLLLYISADGLKPEEGEGEKDSGTAAAFAFFLNIGRIANLISLSLKTIGTALVVCR